MPTYIWRVWCNTEGAYHRVTSAAAPTECPVDPADTIDPVKSVILEMLGAGGHGHKIEVSLQEDDSEPYVEIEETAWTTLGEIIYPGTDAWTPSVSKAIMARCGSGSESGDFCTGGGIKPAQLTMKYTGEDCSASSTSQDSGKWSCSGDPAFAGPVRIVANDKSTWNDGNAKIWYDATVALNASFVIDAANESGETRLKSNTYVHILSIPGDTVLQTVKFHTSCSQPLVIGDQWGGVVLEGAVEEGAAAGGGPSSRYSYRLYDLTNGNVIAEIPDGGGEFAMEILEDIYEATVFSNLPADQAVIEIQAKKSAVEDDDGKIFHVTLEE